MKDTLLFYSGVFVLLAISTAAGYSAFQRAAPLEKRMERQTANGKIRKGENSSFSTEKPRRIVSTDYKGDDTLLALVAPERILALSLDADNPQLGNSIEPAKNVQAPVDANVEKLLNLEPDLVIMGSSDQPMLSAMLQSNGVRVLQLNRAYNNEEIQKNIINVGEAVGEPEKAAEIVRQMQNSLLDLTAKTSRGNAPRVLYVGSGRTYTAGIGTYTDELIRAAGGINVAREAGVNEWGTLTIEKAVAMNPEIIFVPDAAEDRNPANPRVKELFRTPELARDPVWRDVKAVRTGRVYKMPNRLMMCASQLNVRAAEAMAEVIAKAQTEKSARQ